MGKEALIEPFAVQEVYCDGVDHTVEDGMLTATAYRINRQGGRCERIAVVRLVLKVENAMDAMADAREAMRSPLILLDVARVGRH